MSAKLMAYTITPAQPEPNVTRLMRGRAFLRGGQAVPAIPQFKGINLYVDTAPNISGSFQQTVTNFNTNSVTNRVRWPVGPGKQVTSAK